MAFLVVSLILGIDMKGMLSRSNPVTGVTHQDRSPQSNEE